MFSSEAWLANPSSGFYNSVATQSLRFSSARSTRLEKTPNAGNRQVWTWGAWVKRSKLGDERAIWSVGGSAKFALFFHSSTNQLRIWTHNGQASIYTNRVFRDTSSWYHICLTSKNSGNFYELYINGVKETSFATDQRSSYPGGNDHEVNSNDVHYIGAWNNGGLQYFDGYLADVNFLDGVTVGDTNGILDELGELKNGVWIPKKYTGSYGTNGYRLEFKQTGLNGGTGTSSTVGADTANSNHYDSSGIVASDCNMPDSPENNFATLNPLYYLTASTHLSEGNLQLTHESTAHRANAGTMFSKTGKWYFEVRNKTDTAGSSVALGVGLQDITKNLTYASGADNYVFYVNSNNARFKANAGTATTLSTDGTYTVGAGDIVQVAYDVDSGKIFIGLNNTYIAEDAGNDGDPAGGNNPTKTLSTALEYIPFVGTYNNEATANFGQDDTFAGAISSAGNTDGNGNGVFKYAPPQDFLALCTANLPEPTISPAQDTIASDHFNPVLYTGVEGTQAITGVGFQPDWLWIKVRNETNSHYIFDSSRGVNQALFSDLTSDEVDYSSTGRMSAFGTDGFTVQTNGSTGTNGNNDTYVAWNWKAGGTTPTKTYKVVVVSDSGNKYRFRNSADSATFAQSAVTLDLQEGGTYTFDWSDSSAQAHPVRFSLTSNGTHASGSEYTTGVVKNDSAYTTTITVASGVATLYYYCQYHSNMGGQVNTNTTHGSTNFDGSIQSTVQVNATAGFSIVTFTGNGSDDATIGHGLGTTPAMIITKNRDETQQWRVHHKDLTQYYVLYLAENYAQIATNGSSNGYIKTVGSSTYSTHASNVDSLGVNGSGDKMVSYCFAEIEGYSKFGSYTGNGNADGTFVFLGFRPAFLLIKCPNDVSSWEMHDNKRDPFNIVNQYLLAESSGAEGDFDSFDFLSNGFKARTTNAERNGTRVILYMAFSDGQPFKYANGR